jgi:hypothetical protein
MKKLVLHQRYVRGQAWDVSGHGNHGIPSHVAPGSGVFDGSLEFASPDSRVDTPLSASLGELGSFRLSITCTWMAIRDHRGTHHNDPVLVPETLAEGDGAFRLRIVDDPSDHTSASALVQLSIGDGAGGWHVAEGSASGFATGGWPRYDIGHDGISTAWIAIDGRVVLEAAIPGPVPPLGPRGLVIGHPVGNETDRTLRGHVADVWLWNDKPDPPTNDCCGDDDSLASVESLLRQKGWNLAKVKSVRRDVADLTTQWRQHFPEPVGKSIDQASRDLHRALQQQQWADFGNLARQVLHTSQQYVSQDDCNAMGAQLMNTFGNDVLFDPNLYDALFRANLCDPPPSGPRDDGGKHDPKHPRPWGADATPTDPSLDFPPAPKPEGEE